MVACVCEDALEQGEFGCNGEQRGVEGGLRSKEDKQEVVRCEDDCSMDEWLR